jgi:hypothetical protein
MTRADGALWQGALDEAAKVLIDEDCTTDDMFLGATTGGSDVGAIGETLGLLVVLVKTTAGVEVGT